MHKQRVILRGLALIVAMSLNSAGVACYASAQSTQLDNVQQQFATLEASSGGRLGVAAIDTATHREIQYRGDQRFPMGCTSKVMGVAAILKKSMTDSQYLQQNVKYQKKDLVNWTPITEKFLAQGMTVEALCGAAISYSDNTAMNLLTAKLGGPQGINRFARSIGDSSFKLDHWWPDEANGNLFNLQDSSTPNAMARSLQKIALGDVLALPQREKLLTWLKNNTTGNARIRAGVPKEWVVGDKTGSGYEYGTANDIALIWPPNRAPIIVAIFYSSTKKDAPKRNDVIASATRILVNDFVS